MDALRKKFYTSDLPMLLQWNILSSLPRRKLVTPLSYHLSCSQYLLVASLVAGSVVKESACPVEGSFASSWVEATSLRRNVAAQ